VDGLSTKDGRAADLIIESPTGARYEHALKFMFKASNNEPEYEALVVGIELCYRLGPTAYKPSLIPSTSSASLMEHTKRRMMSWPPMFGGFRRPPSY